MVGALLTGSFPRSDDLIEASRAFDRRRLDAEKLSTAFTEDARRVVALEQSAGLEFVDDGLLNWQDLLRPLAEVLPGIKLGALTRWYDNNTFFRKPIVTEPLGNSRPVPDTYYRTDLLPHGKGWRAVLPGPYTFSKLAADRAYGNRRDLQLDLSKVLAHEAQRLEERGFGLIQINEPSLATDPPSKDEQHVLQGAIANIVRGRRAKTLLHTYFGDPFPVLDFLLDLPVSFVGVDFLQASVGSLADHDFNRGLVCGVVDARNSLLEAPREIAEFGAKVQDRLGPKELLLAPNTDLEYLPRGVAEAKVDSLTRAVTIVRGA